MKKYLFLIAMIAILGCSNRTKTEVPSITKLADTYLARLIVTFPEYAYFIDVPLEDHSGYSSNKLTDIGVWENFEDSIYTELSKIDEFKIADKTEKITYWLLKELLESNIFMRVCNRYLWDVNPLNGWQVIWNYVADLQPIGSEQLRTQALERWNKFPSFIDTEIDNLKIGITKGYTMPKVIVSLVIDQLQILLDYNIDESPFMSPAKRDGNEQFYSEWKALLTEKINPSILKYQNFLKTEYLEAARDQVSILSLPNGNECYEAYIRMGTTTNKTGKEIFELGQQLVSDNKNKVINLGSDLYQLTDFKEIINKINNDSSNYFRSSNEILEFSTQILTRAKEECKDWFAILPSTEAIIKPYEAHEFGDGGYERAKGDNPPYFRISLKNPELQQKGQNEILTFHEVYPGHHLQIGIQKDIKGLHPISNLLGCTSYIEGWARYSEQLAEEMGLYQTKTALINRRAWPARGMVVDPGIHLYNWTKEQAINFIMESGENEDFALSLYHRIIIWPAQLTSYDVGGEEIKALRRIAENKLGQNFDIKEFHSKILENGAIPLSALRKIIDEWIDEKAK